MMPGPAAKIKRLLQKTSKEIDVALVTGTFALMVAVIAGITAIAAALIGYEATIHSAAIAKQSSPPPAIMSSAPGEPRPKPSASPSPSRTSYPSIYPATPAPETITPGPAPSAPASPAAPVPSATPDGGRPVLSLTVAVIGPCTTNVVDICLPLSLTVQPVVRENGEQIVSNCQISWTVRKAGSTMFQHQSSCSGNYSTGLELGAGNYEVTVAVTTGSDAQAVKQFKLNVVSSLGNSLGNLLRKL